MRTAFYISVIILFVVLYGCKDKRASIIEEHISTIDGTVTDLNFKLISISDLTPIYVLDSINFIHKQYNVEEAWRNLDTINVKITEFQNDKYPGSRTREFYNWVIPILKKLQYYYQLPKEKILAQRSICVYSIKNPFLNGVKQTLTDTIYFSDDYSIVLDNE